MGRRFCPFRGVCRDRRGGVLADQDEDQDPGGQGEIRKAGPDGRAA
jgi:hypothetical protein